MDELLVIIGAELILLVSVVAMMIRSRRADVLSRRYPDETDYAASHSNSTNQPRQAHEGAPTSGTSLVVSEAESP
jgi:hypothetical protein